MTAAYIYLFILTSFFPVNLAGITLQDTAEKMGATGVCPGTHKCVGNTELEDMDDHVMEAQCPIRMVQSQGDGFLYKSDTWHKEQGGHSDPDAPHQVVLFLTFAESKKASDEKRILPMGAIHRLELVSIRLG
jgi:hypothetical protein